MTTGRLQTSSKEPINTYLQPVVMIEFVSMSLPSLTNSTRKRSVRAHALLPEVAVLFYNVSSNNVTLEITPSANVVVVWTYIF